MKSFLKANNMKKIKFTYQDLINKKITDVHFENIEYIKYFHSKQCMQIKLRVPYKNCHFFSIQPLLEKDLIRKKIRFQALKILKRVAYEKKS